jgi:hypothetical protein
MLDYRIEPLGDYWPAGQPKTAYNGRQSAALFKSTFADTLDKLEYELSRLDAVDVVMRLAVENADLTNRGRLKNTDKQLGFPGVVLNYLARQWRGGQRIETPYELANDTYVTWKANLRGIALTLEALRGIDRWGAARRGQQYTGFSALPPGDGAPPPAEVWTTQRAASFLAEHSGFSVSAILADAEVRTEAHRRAVRRLHPDRGGDHEDMLRLTRAVETLGRA